MTTATTTAGVQGVPVPTNLWELPAEDLPPLLLRVETVARLLDVGRARVYDLIRTGELASVKIGASRRVSAMALRSYVDGLAAAQEPAA